MTPPAPGDGTARADLAARQAALVAALVTGAPTPTGVDPHRVEVAARALRRKHAREVAHHWPALLATPAARAQFDSWLGHRERGPAFTDGWDFADHREGDGGLDPAAAAELAGVRAGWRRTADGTARRRRRWRLPTR